MSVCLDSWAVLAWLDGDEPAHSRLAQITGEDLVMSWVNAVEVYYRIERDHGRHEADEVLVALRTSVDLELPGTGCMVETARLKAKYAMALADCFAVATAIGHHAVLLTGDPEIIDAPSLPCQVEDLRPDSE